jgi:hypothetical protein
VKKLIAFLIVVPVLAVFVLPAPACDVPVQAFAPAYAPVMVQAAPVFQAQAVYAQPAFAVRQKVVRQRAFVPAYSGGAAFVPSSGVNVNVNSGNVGRARLFRR